MQFTSKFQSPEVINDERPGASHDVYSFGMAMCAVVNASYDDVWCGLKLSRRKMEDKILEGGRPRLDETRANSAPEGYIELMKKCWHSEKDKRPRMTEVRRALEVMLNKM